MTIIIIIVALTKRQTTSTHLIGLKVHLVYKLHMFSYHYDSYSLTNSKRILEVNMKQPND